MSTTDRWTLTTALVCALAAPGCPTADPPADDDDDSTSGAAVTFAGRLRDADRAGPLDGCAVGATRDAAETSAADGSFSVGVDPGAVVHVSCAGGVMRSFKLPVGPTAFNWEIPVDMGSGPDLGVQCVPNLSGDAENTGIVAGDGSMELRVLTDSATGSWNTTLPSAGWTVQVTGFLRVPEGPYLVLAKSYGGSVPGFAVSGTLQCDGNGASPTTELELDAVSTTSLSGTWAPAAGSQYSFAASQSLAGVDGKFGWYGYDMLHESDADATSFDLTLLDGIGSGPLTVAACQRAADGRSTCVFKEVGAGALDVGAMPSYVTSSASLDGGAMRMGAIGDVEGGSVVVHLVDDDGDPVWTGWMPGSGSEHEIVVGADWLAELPDLSALQSWGRGARGVTFDYANGFEQTSTPDGWSNFRIPQEYAFF